MGKRTLLLFVVIRSFIVMDCLSVYRFTKYPKYRALADTSDYENHQRILFLFIQALINHDPVMRAS